MAGAFTQIGLKVRRYFQQTLWREEALGKNWFQRKATITLRVVAITLQGIFSNQLLFRGAALSFYSLIGMGPMMAIIVMLSGFMLKSEDPSAAVHTLNKVFTFIAPPVAEYNKISNSNDASSDESEGESVAAPPERNIPPEDVASMEKPSNPELNTELASLLRNMIESARSKTMGVFGLIILIFIAVQLLTTVETTFNQIWGARRGRTWGERVVFYWTFISLGTMLGFGAIGLLSASAVAGLFDFLPFSAILVKAFIFAGPLLSFCFILGLLMAFYQFFPNTNVNWKAALTGAFVTALLLVTNHLLSIIYVSKVIENRSLYGSLGIIPVLMIGLYVFWTLMLLGSQITYAVQNVNYLTNQQAWNNISVQVRELLSISAFLHICRRFKRCEVPYCVSELSEIMHAPAHLLNESLTRLCDMGYLTTSHNRNQRDHDDNEVIRFQPARPLDKISLAELKTAIDEHGSNQGARFIYRTDPLLEWYRDCLQSLKETQLGTKTLDDLLDEKPVIQ